MAAEEEQVKQEITPPFECETTNSPFPADPNNPGEGAAGPNPPQFGREDLR